MVRVPPEARRGVWPEAETPGVRFPAAELEHFKNRMLERWLPTAPSPPAAWAFRRAANEAMALAWLTPYPQLVLPVLLEEKLVEARQQAERQGDIRRRSRAMLTELV